MIRILHILGGLHAGGMESMIMNYYRHIDREKIQFDFLVFCEKSFYDEEVLSLGGKIFRVTSRRTNFIKNYKELDEFFRNNKEYKIVHIHQGINYFAPLIKAKKYKIFKRIVHSHGMDPMLIKRQGIFFNLVTKPKISKLANEFIACSEKAAQQIFIDSIIVGKKYHIMHNCVDTNKFSRDEEITKKTKEKLNIEGKFVLGHVGNFTYPKNHSFLIDIFNEITKINDNSVLILVGEGPGINKIKDKVKMLKLDEKVLFLGNRQDVNEIILAFDRFIFPSHYEGLPLALIEAQACGIRSFASGTITDEVLITQSLEFISLEESAQAWADKIININKEIILEDVKASICEAGYDIKTNSAWLQNYYLDLYNSN